jgi:hypothetical protein
MRSSFWPPVGLSSAEHIKKKDKSAEAYDDGESDSEAQSSINGLESVLALLQRAKSVGQRNLAASIAA